MKCIGIDVGTTTVCGVLVDGKTGEVLESVTKDNDSKISADNDFEKMQDATRIREICTSIYDSFTSKYDDIVAVSVTGQMHGILYLDSEGNPVSPLYSWQDESGNQKFDELRSYSEYLTEKTGYQMATGYGLTTHFYRQHTGTIPKDAVILCTAPDYIAMTFAGTKKPVIHKSMAASLGFFDIEHGCWDISAMEKVELDTSFLPEIAGDKTNLSANAPETFVSVSLGDNQASFMGSVGKDCDILINVGTGGQISIAVDEYSADSDVEFRPYLDGSYLLVGCSLCSGSSYAYVKQFFERTLEMFGMDVPENIYDVLNNAADRASKYDNPLVVDTRFRGTRENPSIRGSITNISADNLLPENIIIGALRGICGELFDTFLIAPDAAKQSAYITGSGNGIRKNKVLQHEAEELFGKKLLIPMYSEEASYGAALFGMYASGHIKTNDEIKNLIRAAD